jgi:hypothetical protein
MHLRVLSLLAVLTATTVVLPAQAIKGEWTLGRSGEPGKVRLSLQSSWDGGNHFSSSSDWSADDLHGLDLSNTARHDVRFTILRDAGQLECDGFLKDGEGAGLFAFNPNPQYGARMSAAGFPGIAADRQFAFALHDVSVAFAQEMKSLGVQELDADKLISFRIHRVTPNFVKDLRAGGIDAINADKLISFRIHGVSPDFVRDLRATGIDVTDADKLISFRIHGVSPDFVRDLQRLGYAKPDPNQLIALRIHRVTPQYIESLRSHGMRDLTLDQLIALRIQGIN